MQRPPAFAGFSKGDALGGAERTSAPALSNATVSNNIAENRLVGITHSGQSGKQTAFVYDGLGRRIAIISTPAGGGSATTTNYIWCGLHPCQARYAANAPVRSYYGEGEFVPGSPAQAYYYGTDQIGSVRRVFAAPSSAPAYATDAFGDAGDRRRSDPPGRQEPGLSVSASGRHGCTAPGEARRRSAGVARPVAQSPGKAGSRSRAGKVCAFGRHGAVS